MEFKDLQPNPRNPRKITDKKLIALKKALLEFGDLGGIVFNRRTGHLIGGHQRINIFKTMPVQFVYGDGYIWIELCETGDRFAYREVDWSEEKEKAANIAANKGAGEWDWDILKDWMKDLDEVNFDLDLTMWDKDDIKSLFRDKPVISDEDNSDDISVKKYIECPDCGHSFELPKKKRR